MTRKFAILAALGASVLSGVAIAQSNALTDDPVQVRSGSYLLDADHGKITWSVDHMGFSTYVGQFTDVSANLDLNVQRPSASKLDASVNMNSVGTFHDGLDGHLKTADFFDTAKFPTATFRATERPRYVPVVRVRTVRAVGTVGVPSSTNATSCVPRVA